MIQRSDYLKEIRSVIGTQVIKVLTGMRRAGKSTLFFQIQAELMQNGVPEEQIISINFEWLEFDELRDYKSLNQYISEKMEPNKKYYIFLDEIQEVQGFERVVNSLNSKGNAEIFITGSNSTLLSGELATYLTGRYYSIEVLPLSFREIVQGNQPLDAQFIEYLQLGGLPGRLQFDSVRTVKNYILDMYQSILLKDIVQRNSIRDVELLQRFMMYLLNNVSQIFSAGTITNYLKSEGRNLSKETIYNYIEAAKKAYLIHSVPRYNLKGKKLMKINEKYFVNDLGIRSLFFNNEQDLGQALENIVYLELRRRRYEVYVGQWGDKGVDFIVVEGSRKAYIQVAYLLADELTIQREFSVLEEIEDNFPKLVISMDSIDRSRNGILQLNIIDFLMDRKKLFSS